jgi:hypothetical protein
MPNWCSNFLKVEGENVPDFLHQVAGHPADYAISETEKQFYELLKDEDEKKFKDFTFNSLVPVPKKILLQGYNNAGYQWQTKNWGTKWDVDAELTEKSKDHLTYYFDSAWSPPLQWVVFASKKFPELTFTLSFYELGNFFCGKTVIVNGEFLDSVEFGDNTDDFWEFMSDEFNIVKEEEMYE